MGRKKNWWVKTDNQWGAPNWVILAAILFQLIGLIWVVTYGLSTIIERLKQY